MIGAQNVEQPWRIYEEDDNITLKADPDCTDSEKAIEYGAELPLTA